MVDPDVAWEDWLGQQRESRAAWCDTAGIVARWTPYVPAEHIHVVTVPPDRTDPRLLLYRFGAAASIDTSSWDIVGAATNLSLDLEQTELLRLINRTTAATMDMDARRRLVNDLIIPRLGAPNADRKRRINVSERAWIEAETDRRIAALVASKATVHGDLTDLLCPDSAWTHRSAGIDDERLTQLAIRALIDVSTRPSRAFGHGLRLTNRLGCGTHGHSAREPSLDAVPVGRVPAQMTLLCLIKKPDLPMRAHRRRCHCRLGCRALGHA